MIIDYFVRADLGTTLGQVGWSECETNIANARLIAAAPDLLAALERAATKLRCVRGMLRDCYLDKVHPCQPCAARKHAWDAIAKAEGGQP